MVYERTQRYRRGERGLETQQQKYIDSAKMKRLLKRLSDHFGWEFIKPIPRPVYISKRIKTYGGYFKGNSIDIAYDNYDKKGTLWHEILHAVVSDNYTYWFDNVATKEDKDNKPYLMHGKIEKAVFTVEGKGEHHAHNFKLSCDCGFWIKTVKKRSKGYCRVCDKTLISPNEYRKLKKISDTDSKIIKVDISHYKAWKENKRIGVKI